MFDATHLQNVQPRSRCGVSKRLNHAKLKSGRAASSLSAALRTTTSGSHGVARPTSLTLLAVATEDVRLYTLFLPVEP
ncbi:MAG: hypothetical protein DMF48_07465 [Verrucomicrobia bacterium]|nr:MAG: hypothetical protein DMF48_07465 [Verrucomicrobiota bacterium]